MAGRPKYRALVAHIEAVGGIEWVCDLIRAGDRTLTQIAAMLGTTRPILYQYLHVNEEHKRLYQRARLESAGALAEQAMQIVDESDPMVPASVQQARERSGVRRWLAERFDRDTFGQPVGGNVIQIGELHLDALRKYGGPSVLPPGQGVDVVDAEVVMVEPALEDLL
jgi:hypothetical protein